MSSPQKSHTTIHRTVTKTVTSNYSAVDLAHESNSIEVENQRNINNGLQVKLAAYNDLQNDVASYHQKLAGSEAARADLQMQL